MSTAPQPSYQPLPCPSDEESQVRGNGARSRRKDVVAVGGLVLGVVIGVAGLTALHPPRGQLVLVHHAHDAAPAEARASSANGSLPLELSAKPAYSTECWPFTGGTCNVQQCFSWRDAHCTKYAVLHYCMCQEGMCTSVDNKCVAEQNKLVASGIKLKSAHYRQTMYIPNSIIKHALRLTSGSTGDQDLTFWEVPGTATDGMKRYMISSAGHPGSVVEWENNQGVISIGSSMLKVADADPNTATVFPSDSFWVVCGRGDGTLQLGASASGTYVWAYAHKFSWMVYGWTPMWGKPDVRAAWVADPPLPFDVSPCP